MDLLTALPDRECIPLSLASVVTTMARQLRLMYLAVRTVVARDTQFSELPDSLYFFMLRFIPRLEDRICMASARGYEIDLTSSPERERVPLSLASISRQWRQMCFAVRSVVAGRDSRFSELPIDILHLIFLRFVPRLDDRIRMAAVCKHWRSAWLMQPPSWMAICPDARGDFDGRCLSLSDGRFYHIGLPDLRSAVFCGSIDNWLVVADRNRGNYLLNPFSRAEILLPHQSTIPDKDFAGSWKDPNLIRKVILSSSPNKWAPDHPPIVIAALYGLTRLATCSLGGSEWTCLRDAPQLSDIIFYKGVLYGIDVDGHVYTIQTDDNLFHVVKMFVIDTVVGCSGLRYPPLQTKYLAESHGRLLMVRRFWDSTYISDPVSGAPRFQQEPPFTRNFKVSELILGAAAAPCWVELETLSGDAIFLGSSCTKAATASQYLGVEEDCIYFTDDDQLARRALSWPMCGEYRCSGVFFIKTGEMAYDFPSSSGKDRYKLLTSKTESVWLHFTCM